MRYKTIFVNTGLIFILVIAVSGFSGALAITHQSVTANAEERLLPIYAVETAEKKIAITFDAAWSDNDTDELINILKKYNAKATFFCVGDYVRQYPTAVKKFYKNGHEIGNHSDTHKLYSKNTSDVIKSELSECNKEIKKIIGIVPKVCRAPSGDYDNKSINIARSLNMEMIQWDIDSRDWKKYSAEKMHQNIINHVENGSIILFHNGVENTPEALDMVLHNLSKKGYKFVTVSELIYKDNYKIDNFGRQVELTIN